jgi:tripartite-type tricarboxylate transporter receptor subunit TctC
MLESVHDAGKRHEGTSVIMRFAFFIGAGALVAASAVHAAQPLPTDYPSKPIRVVVPSPPGGPPDLIMRMLAPKMSASIGQQLVIDNRPGAGGVVGSNTVAKSPPDGYTWLFTTASHTNTPPFNKNVPFDPVRDFSHLSLVVQNFGQAVVVPAS